MKTTQILIMSSILLSPLALAQNQNTTKETTYGDNPNIVRVLAGKTQSAVQNTAEKIGAATERGIAKIKPTVDNTWNGTKEYTTEQAVIARDNTRQGIDTAVKKVKETKENLVGSGGVPIERGAMSQSTPQNDSVSQNTSVQYNAPIQQIAPPIQTNVPTTDNPNLNPNSDSEIQRQSLPIQNNANSDDSDAGLPR